MNSVKTAKNATYALILLTAVNYLNYIDRYILASMLPYIKQDMGLSDFQLGLLSSAFIYPYLLVAPLFGILGDRVRRNYLSAIGIGIWSVATVLTGMSPNYTALMGSRMFLGIGEASFSVVAPAWLSDFFSPAKRGKVMAIFTAALPVGAAIGYIVGGLFGNSIGWRMGFMIVGGPGLILAAMIYFLKDRSAEKRALNPQTQKGDPSFSLNLFKNLIFDNGAFRNIVLGYCAYTFVVGGLAHWMPIYLDRFYKASMGDLPAGVVFGAVAAISGLIGTLVGGFAGDKWDQKSGNGYTKLSAISMWLSIPPFIVTVGTESFSVFIVGLFFTMLMMFISTSPINVMILNAVSLGWRSSAMAMAIFACHFLGDAISTPFVGYISDHHGGLKNGVIATIPFAAICAIYWTWVVLRHWRTVPLYENPVPRGLQSHRGVRQDKQGENSETSIRAAFENGYTSCETDVRLSSDGIAILSHDEDLNGSACVSQMSAAELKQGHDIDTLEQVLSNVQPGDWLNIEIKWQSGREQEAVDAVATVVERTNCQQRVLVSSFHPGIVRRFSKRIPEIPRAVIMGKKSRWANYTMFWARAHFVHIQDQFLSDAHLEKIVERGVAVGIWTVNDRQRCDRLIDIGVHTVISDNLKP